MEFAFIETAVGIGVTFCNSDLVHGVEHDGPRSPFYSNLTAKMAVRVRWPKVRGGKSKATVLCVEDDVNDSGGMMAEEVSKKRATDTAHVLKLSAAVIYYGQFDGKRSTGGHFWWIRRIDSYELWEVSNDNARSVMHTNKLAVLLASYNNCGFHFAVFSSCPVPSGSTHPTPLGLVAPSNLDHLNKACTIMTGAIARRVQDGAAVVLALPRLGEALNRCRRLLFDEHKGTAEQFRICNEGHAELKKALVKGGPADFLMPFRCRTLKEHNKDRSTRSQPAWTDVSAVTWQNMGVGSTGADGVHSSELLTKLVNTKGPKPTLADLMHRLLKVPLVMSMWEGYLGDSWGTISDRLLCSPTHHPQKVDWKSVEDTLGEYEYL